MINESKFSTTYWKGIAKSAGFDPESIKEIGEDTITIESAWYKQGEATISQDEFEQMATEPKYIEGA